MCHLLDCCLFHDLFETWTSPRHFQLDNRTHPRAFADRLRQGHRENRSWKQPYLLQGRLSGSPFKNQLLNEQWAECMRMVRSIENERGFDYKYVSGWEMACVLIWICRIDVGFYLPPFPTISHRWFPFKEGYSDLDTFSKIRAELLREGSWQLGKNDCCNDCRDLGPSIFPNEQWYFLITRRYCSLKLFEKKSDWFSLVPGRPGSFLSCWHRMESCTSQLAPDKRSHGQL